MTLRIHNITYDHSLEFRTYPAGVLTIDTLTRAIHVHDGLTPNGWGQPTSAELGNYALKDLTNVTQESMNNALNTFGAFNINNADRVSDAQRDNAWTKLFGPAMLSTADVPEKNYLYVDKKDRKMKAGDLSTVTGFGLDFTKKKDRQAGVTYRADEDGWIYFRGYIFGYGPVGPQLLLTVDGVETGFFWMNGFTNSKVVGSGMTMSGMVPVAAGQSYALRADNGVQVYYFCPLKSRFQAAATKEG
jgi:hypothetical protein